MAQLLPYIRMLQRGWWIIALAALAAFNFALLNNYNATPMYRARAQFLVSPGPTILAGESDDLVRSIEALDKRSIVATYAEILGSGMIFDETLSALQIDRSTVSDYDRSAVVLPDASVLELTVEGPNPEVAALLANQVGDQAIDRIKGLYLAYDINFLDPATVASSPFSPVPMRDSAIALVLGGIAGVVLVLGRELLTSPITFFNQQLHVNRASTAYTNRYMHQLVDDVAASGDGGAVSLLRINNFQGLKETLPEPIWQDLLLFVVQKIRAEIRGKDTVGHWDELTFVLLQPDIEEDTAVLLMTAINNMFTRPVILSTYSDEIQLHTEIGLTCFVEGVGGSHHIKVAEQALDQASLNQPPVAVLHLAESSKMPA